MPHTRCLPFLAATVTLLASVPSQQPAPERNDAQRLATACNRFGADLHGQFPGSTAPTASPASIALALAMLLPGARGDTADELAAVLHLPPELRGERLRTAAADLLRALGATRDDAGGDGPRLRLANDLWTQTGYAVAPAYVAALRDAFAAAWHEVGFQDDPEAARRTINAHIAKATFDRIPELLPAGLIGADTRVVLTNAIWLKAAWQEPFLPRATQPAPFHLADGTTADVPMMRRAEQFAYAESDDWQCVVLPFAASDLVCEVVLPRPGKPLAAAERALLDGAHLDRLAAARVDVHLPRFRSTGSFRLREALQALGLRAAFDGSRADFTGIAAGGGLVLDDVVHQTWIAVDEQGAEAAAATAAVMKRTGMPAGKPVAFVADRPFAFVLRHRTSGLVLFLGRVDDPRQAPARAPTGG